MNIQSYFKAIFTLIIVLFATVGYGQDRVKEQAALQQKRQLRSFYRSTLQVDSAKAEQVAEIQDTYKAGVKALMADTTFSPAWRQTKIQALVEIKNQQLRKLLSPAQQEKVIPGTERSQSVKKD